MNRLLIVLFVLALADVATGPAAPAHAQQYQGCQATVSDVTVAPGQTITVTGSGADPGDTVTAAINSTIGSGDADANGNFSFPATVPADLSPGTYTLTVRCGDGATDIIIEVGLIPVSTGPVPRTGSNSPLPFAKLGIALIAAGGLALAVSRRRRWANVSST